MNGETATAARRFLYAPAGGARLWNPDHRLHRDVTVRELRHRARPRSVAPRTSHASLRSQSAEAGMVRIGEKTDTTMPAVASAHTTAAISVNPPGTNCSTPPTTTGATAPNTPSSVSHTEETRPFGLHHTRRLVAGYAKGPLP